MKQTPSPHIAKRTKLGNRMSALIRWYQKHQNNARKRWGAFDGLLYSVKLRKITDQDGWAGDGIDVNVPPPQLPDATKADELPVDLPSSHGWEWCSQHTTLAELERRLQVANMDHHLQQIWLSLVERATAFRKMIQKLLNEQQRNVANNTRGMECIHEVNHDVSLQVQLYSNSRDAISLSLWTL